MNVVYLFMRKWLNVLLIFLLLFSCLPVPAQASTGEQDQINDLLSAGGRVVLEDREYILTGPLYIPANTELTGGSNTVLKVECPNGKWFSNSIAVINTGKKVGSTVSYQIANNISIHGFQINGNVVNLPASYHQSSSSTDHDCECLIRLMGSSSSFGSNVYVYDMTLYDSFSDGMSIRFINNARLFNNVISNCQHEGIFCTCCIDSIVYGNKIAGITSDCLRLDNCVRCKVYDNIFFSYSGTHASNTYMHGEAGIQVADAGSSHGYDGSNKPTTTQDIEIYNNSFINCGRVAMWIHGAAAESSANVYVHDNTVIGEDELITSGSTFDLNILEYINGNYSYESTPTLQDSKNIFENITNILNFEFFDDGNTDQILTEISGTVDNETEKGYLSGGIEVAGYTNSVYIDGVQYVPNDKSYVIKNNVVLSPSYIISSMGTANITKENDVKIKNGKIYAAMKVKLTGTVNKVKDNKIYTSTRTIQETTFRAEPVPYPEIIDIPDSINVQVDTYQGANNYSYVTLPDQIGLQRVELTYQNLSSDYVYLIGERAQDENGIIYTIYTKLDMWDGNLNHVGKKGIIEEQINISDLDVKVYNVYGEIPVNITHNIHNYTGEKTSFRTILNLMKLFILMYTLYYLVRKPFRK